LTEDASEEYGQGVGCLFHLPSGDPGRGGEHGEKSLGVLTGCQVKQTAGQENGEAPRPDKIPLKTRFGTTSQGEGFTERRGPRLRRANPISIVENVPHGPPPNVSRGTQQVPCYTARAIILSTPHCIRKVLYGPAWVPVPTRSV
jgi:hypothetical protein